MIIYYITILALLVIGFIYSDNRISDGVKRLMVILSSVLLVMIFGFRHEVGPDWFSYERSFLIHIESVFDFTTFEVGYKYLNIISGFFGFGIHGVNFFIIFILVCSVFYAARKVGVNPFYLFAIVAPYHLIMSGMNLNRQALALSFFLLSISFLIRNKNNHYLLLIVIGSLFHMSAIIFAPLYFIGARKRFIVLIFLLIALPLTVIIFLQYSHYLDSSYKNSGVFLRLGFLLVASLLIFLSLSQVRQHESIVRRLCYFTLFSAISLSFLSLINDTIVDRVVYYLILLSALLVLYLNKDRSASLKSCGPTILFLTSISAFTIWVAYSHLIYYYHFKSYLLVTS